MYTCISIFPTQGLISIQCVSPTPSFRIIRSLESFVEGVNISSLAGNTSNNRRILTYNNFALQIEDIDPKTFDGQSFVVNLGSVEEAQMNKIDEKSLETFDTIVNESNNATASIHIPHTVFDGAVNSPAEPQSDDHRLSYFVFAKDLLFRPTNQTHSRIGSIIVSAKTSYRQNDNGTLTEPIQIKLKINRVSPLFLRAWNNLLSNTTIYIAVVYI